MILTNGKIAGYLSWSEHIKDKSVSMIDDIIKSIQKVSNIEYEPINYSAEIFDVFQLTGIPSPLLRPKIKR